ncbi:MAG: hypothetical protein LBM77_07040 [Spirochaetaceae bacterium]|jgi:hypothetical protein|nr:hypothetical protein [Spirochaetaceae bacterium]
MTIEKNSTTEKTAIDQLGIAFARLSSEDKALVVQVAEELRERNVSGRNS